MSEKRATYSKQNSNRVRLILGGGILVASILSPLLILKGLNSDLSTTLKSVLSGLLAIGFPEIFMIVAMAIMGMQGYRYPKDQFFKRLNNVSPDRVSRTRYRIGIVLFSIPLILGFLQPYLAYYLPRLTNLPLIYTVLMDLMLLLSLFVLGGDFWEKHRGLFRYDVTVTKNM